MQGIITNTLWALPSVFIPLLFDEVFIDACLMALLMAMTLVYVARSLVQVNRRFKVSRHLQQAAMTVGMWIKSHIKTDKAKRSLAIAKDITSTLPNVDMLESQQKQCNMSSSQDYLQTFSTRTWTTSEQTTGHNL
jgi:hypothetical protein